MQKFFYQLGIFRLRLSLVTKQELRAEPVNYGKALC